MSIAPHAPTDATRAQVDALAGLVGLAHAEIADYLGIDIKVLRSSYEKELRTASIKANSVVAKSLFTAAKEGNTQAQIFWLKTRAGWTEKTSVSIEAGPRVLSKASAEVNAAALKFASGNESEAASILSDPLPAEAAAIRRMLKGKTGLSWKVRGKNLLANF